MKKIMGWMLALILVLATVSAVADTTVLLKEDGAWYPLASKYTFSMEDGSFMMIFKGKQGAKDNKEVREMLMLATYAVLTSDSGTSYKDVYVGYGGTDGYGLILHSDWVDMTLILINSDGEIVDTEVIIRDGKNVA